MAAAAALAFLQAGVSTARQRRLAPTGLAGSLASHYYSGRKPCQGSSA